MHDIKINSVTGSEVVTTQEVKDFVRIDTSTDDTIIARMITTARLWCENYIGKDIVAKNRTFYLKEADDRFTLPFAPVASISSVTSEGSAVDYTTYGLDDIIVEIDTLPAKEVKVTYVTSGLTDSLLKDAILHLVATYYDNRSDYIANNMIKAPITTNHILQGFKAMWF